LDAVVVFKYDTWRVDDPQAALELNRLQLRVSRLRRNGTHLHKEDPRVIKNGKIKLFSPGKHDDAPWPV
jgi:hypothetical protein